MNDYWLEILILIFIFGGFLLCFLSIILILFPFGKSLKDRWFLLGVALLPFFNWIIAYLLDTLMQGSTYWYSFDRIGTLLPSVIAFVVLISLICRFLKSKKSIYGWVIYLSLFIGVLWVIISTHAMTGDCFIGACV